MVIAVGDVGHSGRGFLVRVGQVVLVSLVAIIGWKLTLPGLDETVMRSQNGDISRFSILALGVSPLVTAFALGQIFRLLAPRLAEKPVLMIIENALVLAVALSQAYGIAQAFLAMGLLTDESVLGLGAVVASLVGGVAVMLFLSRQCVWPSIAAGFWALWLLPAIIGLPAQLSSSWELLRFGAVGGSELIRTTLTIIIAAGLAFFAIRTVALSHGNLSASGGGRPHVLQMNIVLWPPLLAATASGYIMVPLALLAPELLPDAQWLRAYIFVATALLIPIFVLAYRRLLKRNDIALPLLPTLLLAAVQIVLMLGGAFAAEWLAVPLPVSGTTLLVMVAFAYALFFTSSHEGDRSAGQSRNGVV